MNKKIRQLTETAVLLALLVALQALTKPLGQVVTGSFVNAVLAISALTAGLYSGLAVAIISPVLAYLLGIAPQILTVPAIMVGNAVYVVALYFIYRKGSQIRGIIAWAVAAAAKFATLYAIVVWLICGALSEKLLSSGMLNELMLKMLPVTFSTTQLITALIGGAIGLLITPAIRKALHK